LLQGWPNLIFTETPEHPAMPPSASEHANSHLSASKQTEIGVAVLPFKNISIDSSLDHFCQGFMLELITDFSRFKCFRIISYNSSSLLDPDTTTESDTIKSLNVDYIVKGTFSHRDNLVNIYVQLISTRDNRLVWAGKYNDNIDHIFAIEENVLQQLVVALQQQLNADILSDYKKKPLANLNAYACWLLGFNELKKGALEADEKAREYFQQAIDIDPQYSKAYTGMSLTYFNEWSCQIWDRWDVSRKGAFEYAKKAFDIDDNDYTSALVLGRIYLYNGAYDTAEHFLRKAIRLNPNDTDILIQAASCLAFLGYPAEGLKLYYRAMNLNPAGNESYRSYGIILHFENGEYEKALEIAQLDIGRYGWVDMPGFIAANYYMLGDEEKMNEYWKLFEEEFGKKITYGKDFAPADPLEWMIRANPQRGGSKITIFWDYMRERLNIKQPVPVENKKLKSAPFLFVQWDGVWHIAYEGKDLVMPAVKGLSDIHKLLGAGGRDIHCSELMGTSAATDDSYLVFDEKAKHDYREKITRLKEAISNAERMGAESKLQKLQDEYDQLINYLSASTGLGGKSRKAGNTVDKVRSAVTWRIRNAIERIEKKHPLLAKHLSVSIKTGTYCSYTPEKVVDWSL
jgi:TolB-like protein/Tfp pilus assembly protein PilF